VELSHHERASWRSSRRAGRYEDWCSPAAVLKCWPWAAGASDWAWRSVSSRLGIPSPSTRNRMSDAPRFVTGDRLLVPVGWRSKPGAGRGVGHRAPARTWHGGRSRQGTTTYHGSPAGRHGRATARLHPSSASWQGVGTQGLRPGNGYQRRSTVPIRDVQTGSTSAKSRVTRSYGTSSSVSTYEERAHGGARSSALAAGFWEGSVVVASAIC